MARLVVKKAGVKGIAERRGLDPRGGNGIAGRPYALHMRERMAIDMARRVGRIAIGKAMKVWIDGLRDSDKWFRAHCAKEIANRCGLPVMTEVKGQIEVAAVPVMAFAFSNTFPEPIDVEVDREESIFPRVNEGEEAKSLEAGEISETLEGVGGSSETSESDFPGTPPTEAKTPEGPETPQEPR
jgi:hypothetical protein